MTGQPQFKGRSFRGETDLQSICDLMNICDAHDKLNNSVDIETLRTRLNSPEIDQNRDLHLWEDTEGELVGFAQLEQMESDHGEAESRGLLRIDPRARSMGLEDTIIDWMSERMREVGTQSTDRRFFVSAREYDSYNRGVLSSRGFTPVRYFFRMACSLKAAIPEPQFPPGYTLRNVKGPEEMGPWVEMYNESFIDHWNHHPLNVETAVHFMSLPDYRAELDLVGVAPDGTWAGFCFCEINTEQNKQSGRKDGWTALVGTRRGHRKIGLGRAMLLAGLHALQDAGMDTALLGVDADNPTGALGLYESVGFERVFMNIIYGKDV